MQFADVRANTGARRSTVGEEMSLVFQSLFFFVSLSLSAHPPLLLLLEVF